MEVRYVRLELVWLKLAETKVFSVTFLEENQLFSDKIRFHWKIYNQNV